MVFATTDMTFTGQPSTTSARLTAALNRILAMLTKPGQRGLAVREEEPGYPGQGIDSDPDPDPDPERSSLAKTLTTSDLDAAGFP